MKTEPLNLRGKRQTMGLFLMKTTHTNLLTEQNCEIYNGKHQNKVLHKIIKGERTTNDLIDHKILINRAEERLGGELVIKIPSVSKSLQF